MRNKLIVVLMTIVSACSQPEPADLSNMKLFRFGPEGNEKPGVELNDGRRIDVSGFGEDFNEKFFETSGVTRLKEWLTLNAGKCPEADTTARFGPCVSRPSKIIAIGLNYKEHIAEGRSPAVPQSIPVEPIIFFKSTTALCGPYDDAIIPKNSRKMDWEVELAVVIGKKASYVSVEDALDYVAGYSVMNDYSEREWQLEKDGKQWDKGKGADTFAPMGPYLILPENIGDAQNLDLWLNLNGTNVQKANTRDMIFSIPVLISYISHHMTLLPGDIISTGTPAGVGNAMIPAVYLKEGDVVELGVDGIGVQKQNVKNYR